MAKLILQQVYKQRRTETHLIFDKTISPSTKDSERNKRDDNRHVAYQITGAEQKRLSNWLQSLRVDQFKEALVEFLITFQESNKFAFVIGSKKIFVNSGDTCFLICNEDGLIVRRIAEEYKCSHEEADSRMLFHVSKCSTPSNIVIRTADTDVFTGSDYTALFNRKGKIRPLKPLEKDESVQQVFSKFHDWDSITGENIQVVEGFVCSMYEKKRFQPVGELLLELFLKKYNPNNDSLVDKVWKLDSPTLAPCLRVLMKKLKRSSYITRLWRNFLNASAQDQDVLSFG